MGRRSGIDAAAPPAPRSTRMVDPALVDRHVWLAGLVDPAQGERVVDLGCGRASCSTWRRCRPSPRSPGRARGHGSSTPTWPVPPPLADRSVDAVFCHDVLELLPDGDALLREVWRVLRPGGRLVLGHADFDTAVLAGADAGGFGRFAVEHLVGALTGRARPRRRSSPAGRPIWRRPPTAARSC